MGKKNIEIKKPGRPPLKPEQLTNFLEKLAVYGNVSESAKAIGVSVSPLYHQRRDNPEFAKAWDEAAAIGARALEDEARRRAFKGWKEPVFFQGNQVAVVRRFSDQLLMFLLRAHLPEKYGNKVQAEVSGPGGAPIPLKIEVEFVDPTPETIDVTPK